MNPRFPSRVTTCAQCHADHSWLAHKAARSLNYESCTEHEADDAAQCAAMLTPLVTYEHEPTRADFITLAEVHAIEKRNEARRLEAEARVLMPIRSNAEAHADGIAENIDLDIGAGASSDFAAEAATVIAAEQYERSGVHVTVTKMFRGREGFVRADWIETFEAALEHQAWLRATERRAVVNTGSGAQMRLAGRVVA